MCEECENPAAPHLSYTEKRKRIDATWQPARKAGRQFLAVKLAARAPLTPQGEIDPKGLRSD